MDDGTTTSNESDTETCMVVEVEEDEFGEIMLLERSPEQVYTDNTFCVVDCEIEPSETESSDSPTFAAEDIPENIEIVYLPNYDNPNNGPVLLKQELLLHNDDEEDPEGADCDGYEIDDSGGESFLPVRTGASPKVYRRGQKRTFAQSGTPPKKLNGVVPKNNTLWRETRLRSNPNIILKHQGVFHPRDRSWTLKLDAKDFVQTKSISSVTTIHTKPKSTSGIDGSENETIPDSRMVSKDSETSAKTIANILPHKCEYCDRAFRQSVSLQIHSTLHSQSIPDSCLVS